MNHLLIGPGRSRNSWGLLGGNAGWQSSKKGDRFSLQPSFHFQLACRQPVPESNSKQIEHLDYFAITPEFAKTLWYGELCFSEHQL